MLLQSIRQTASPVQLHSLLHFLHAIKYATLDELHENDPGLAIHVVSGSVNEGLVPITFHIYNFFTIS